MAVLEENYVAERHVESFSFWLQKSQDFMNVNQQQDGILGFCIEWIILFCNYIIRCHSHYTVPGHSAAVQASRRCLIGQQATIMPLSYTLF